MAVPKISDQSLSRVCVRIWTSDRNKLLTLTTPTLGEAEIIRDIIHKFVQALSTRERAAIDQAPLIDLDFNLEDLENTAT